MEINAKKKLFICKFCNKRYPCGKSLGGHIRIHLNGNGIENGNSMDADDESFREKPKKTRESMADSNASNLLKEKVCKECGKGFQSLKALCGHMACHSRSSFEDRSETSVKLKDEIFDSQSDNEKSSDSRKRRRSTRTRYKTIGLQLATGSSSSSSASASSDVEQEQEEVARCLMLLSKDSGFKGCFSSFADPSDDNSVALDTKSSSHKLRISMPNNVNCVYSSNGILEKKKKKAKQKEVISTGNHFSVNSDSGCFKFGPKRIESDISVHGFNKKDEIRKQKMEFRSRFEDDFDSQLGKRLSRFRRIKPEIGNDLTVDNGYALKCNSNNPELLGNIAQKTGKCFVSANRVCHSRTNGYNSSSYQSGENSSETNHAACPLPCHSKKNQSCSRKTRIDQNLSGNMEIKPSSKKGKVHECPFCSKVFRSGQALGGHKRSHFLVGAEDRTVVINQQVPETSMPALIDLNLPAPMEEENANENNIP